MTQNEFIAAQPDWWGRLMAFGSILIAGSALWFTQQDKILGGSQAEGDVHSTQMVNQLAQVDEALKLIRQQSDDNDLLRQQLTDRDTRLDTLLARMEPVDDGNVNKSPGELTETLPEESGGASGGVALPVPSPKGEVPADVSADPNNFDALFGDESLDTNSALAARNSLSSTVSRHDADVADLVFDWLSQADEEPLTLMPPPTNGNPTDRGTLLKIVHVTQKPLATDYDINVTVRNTGERSAIVSELAFHPAEVIRDIPTTHAFKPLGQSTDSELVVTLTEAHNRSKEPGTQGKYVYRLPKSYTIPADATIDIRLAILDRDHVGFGLGGNLEMTFNDSETMLIPDVQLAFIGVGDPAGQ